jgi:hypothetical protein
MLRPTERNGTLVITGVLFCIGIYAILNSLTMPTAQFDVSGPGTFPKMLGTILCVVCFISFISAYLSDLNTIRVDIGHRDAWLIMLATVVVGILMKFVGFVSITTFFIFFLLKLLSKTGWIKCVIISVVGAVAAYLLFDTVMGIQLPGGYFFR